MTARRTRSRGTKARREGPAEAVEETTTSPKPKAASKTPKPKAKAASKGKASKSKRSRGRPRVSNTDTERVTLRIEKEHLQTIDLLVQLKQYSNRSDAIRQAIKLFCDEALEEVDDLIERQEKKQKLARLAALADQLAELNEQ
jgi:Arc/MetJ-type ribon-helix-helix transcriptional regulator